MVLQNTNGWFLLAEIVIIWSGVEPRHQGVFVFGTSIFKRCLGDAHVQSKLRASELDTQGGNTSGERTEELMWVQWKNQLSFNKLK